LLATQLNVENIKDKKYLEAWIVSQTVTIRIKFASHSNDYIALEFSQFMLKQFRVDPDPRIKAPTLRAPRSDTDISRCLPAALELSSKAAALLSIDGTDRRTDGVPLQY